MNIKQVGVIGAGVMGQGVSQVLSQKGFEVVLVDTTEDILENAIASIKKTLRFERLLKGDEENLNERDTISRIKITTRLEDLKNVDFVIENVTEKWEIKKDIYPVIDDICPKHCIFGVNTSALSITRIAAQTKRPDKVIGMHFMNPVPMKSVVETIKGYHTSNETICATNELLNGMGKESIIVNDAPGFVSNRVLMLTINEAVFLLQDQVATPENVDRIFKECFGHKMGPLETADLIGIDTILYSIEVLYESFNDSKYRPCPLLKQMVNAGLFGRKSGKGFYDYYSY
ncbi:3-hydroxyacyl-CoA dehydrogenase family protein [Bacillus wiedmannii]|uniref:3-hydroxyacyl-CoA dehydrogenase family protein n=1 Tax=Bacillus wiedmannii TaxID=1890302 RepID=UPI000BF1D96C|nr:3-hydroxyacyl-CoA dehydrogenase NAD-binding domain-containing protein [Bacillus wiedmannii]PEL51878.1 3-hydroxybutyryl-CoA dehydrogenase [Bacillus wiedmannii]PEO05023.1 3-hydroxybutyryl-CoA dehydrogenase [Bacillus wiedmannii]PEP98151.1 3-hydroxybutyryl-CoA dehydrogenase [Bacillus wiedmannii]